MTDPGLVCHINLFLTIGKESQVYAEYITRYLWLKKD